MIELVDALKEIGIPAAFVLAVFLACIAWVLGKIFE